MKLSSLLWFDVNKNYFSPVKMPKAYHKLVTKKNKKNDMLPTFAGILS